MRSGSLKDIKTDKTLGDLENKAYCILETFLESNNKFKEKVEDDINLFIKNGAEIDSIISYVDQGKKDIKRIKELVEV